MGHCIDSKCMFRETCQTQMPKIKEKGLEKEEKISEGSTDLGKVMMRLRWRENRDWILQ